MRKLFIIFGLLLIAFPVRASIPLQEQQPKLNADKLLTLFKISREMLAKMKGPDRPRWTKEYSHQDFIESVVAEYGNGMTVFEYQILHAKIRHAYVKQAEERANLKARGFSNRFNFEGSAIILELSQEEKALIRDNWDVINENLYGGRSPVDIIFTGEGLVYGTLEECEQMTGKVCDFVMCDDIPQGKTFEEVCGFQKGWTPVDQPADE